MRTPSLRAFDIRPPGRLRDTAGCECSSAVMKKSPRKVTMKSVRSCDYQRARHHSQACRSSSSSNRFSIGEILRPAKVSIVLLCVKAPALPFRCFLWIRDHRRPQCRPVQMNVPPGVASAGSVLRVLLPLAECAHDSIDEYLSAAAAK